MLFPIRIMLLNDAIQSIPQKSHVIFGSVNVSLYHWTPHTILPNRPCVPKGNFWMLTIALNYETSIGTSAPEAVAAHFFLSFASTFFHSQY